jgi:hypothetical protein
LEVLYATIQTLKLQVRVRFSVLLEVLVAGPNARD